MKKGIILTMSVQQNNSIQYTLQDQHYLPRVRNYLMLEHGDVQWEKKAFFELTEETIQDYQVVAFTALTKKFVKQLQQWKPDLEVIFLPADQFMKAMAPRSFVINMSTGYVLAEAPAIAIKDAPVHADQPHYNNEDLRHLMEKYPTIYWKVVTLADLKKKLDSKTINTTIALTPAAAPYRKLLASSYPTVPIISAVAEKNPQQSTLRDEQWMIAITSVTSLLLILLALF